MAEVKELFGEKIDKEQKNGGEYDGFAELHLQSYMGKLRKTEAYKKAMKIYDEYEDVMEALK